SSRGRTPATTGPLGRLRGVDCPDCQLSVVAAPLAAAATVVAAGVVIRPAIVVPGVGGLRRFGARVLALVVVVVALVVVVIALVVLGLGLLGLGLLSRVMLVGRLGSLRGFRRLAGFRALRGLWRLTGFGGLTRLELVARLRGAVDRDRRRSRSGRHLRRARSPCDRDGCTTRRPCGRRASSRPLSARGTARARRPAGRG